MNQRKYKIGFSKSELPGHDSDGGIEREIHAFDFRDAYEIAHKLIKDDKELWLSRIVYIKEVN